MYQSLTDILLKRRIELHFAISCPPEQGEGEAEGSILRFEEENAIRYAAGYVLRSVRMKACKQKKDNLVEAVDILVTNDDVEENDLSTSWTSFVDRGGFLDL